MFRKTQCPPLKRKAVQQGPVSISAGAAALHAALIFHHAFAGGYLGTVYYSYLLGEEVLDLPTPVEWFQRTSAD